MRSYDVFSRNNEYLLDPNKTTSLLLQSIENTTKGTVIDNMFFRGLNLLPQTAEKIGIEKKSDNFHNSFLDRLMPPVKQVEKKVIRISCGIIDIGGATDIWRKRT